MARGRGSDRSYAPITIEHLRRLKRIAEEDRAAMFDRHPHLAVYRKRVLMVALCQGAALHYVNGTNRIKDLDVYTFSSEMPGVLLHPRRSVAVDFGESEFGFWSKEEPIKG